MTTVYDGINTDAQDIHKVIQPGDKVAYYIDGLYKWSDAEIALFAGYDHITITVLGNPADAADCETGDMTPAQAAAWVVRQKAAGYYRPTVYRSLGVMQDIRNATGPLVMGKDWDSWVADYDNKTDQVYPGAALKQYRSLSDMDMSILYDPAWPHRKLVVPTPPSHIPAGTPRWGVGVVLQFGNVGNAVHVLQSAMSNSGLYGVRNIVVDGRFGPQTKTAVENLEAAGHIDQDGGIAGPQVRALLIHMGLMTPDGFAA